MEGPRKFYHLKFPKIKKNQGLAYCPEMQELRG